MSATSTFDKKRPAYSLIFKTFLFFSNALLFHTHAAAHNGAVAYAYPVDPIAIDGNLADWPATAVKYPIQAHLFKAKPAGAADCSAFFQIGYNLQNQSLYIALEITDDDYVRDTTKKVRFNTQDGLELYLDARHLPQGSGVASYLYTKDFKHLNKLTWDPVADKAGWDQVEVVMIRQGDKTMYEWRIHLDGQLNPGRSVGVDFQVFDKDQTGDFTVSAWGKGDYKFRNPNSLGDVLLMDPNMRLGTAAGKIRWDKPVKDKLPGKIGLYAAKNPGLWAVAEVDSLGQYAVQLPAGDYRVSLPGEYLHRDKNIYPTASVKPVQVRIKAGKKVEAAVYTLSGTPVSDLIPETGILHGFDAGKSREVDNFVENYRKYYEIPGVSLALIKDGQVVYHKTYGVRNSITKIPVDENTLFEAASVTKPVFAYTVQRLAEKGVIDLDKPLCEYLPYADIEYDERYKLITARHVLTHRTGFPNWRWMNADGKLDLKFTPGTKYQYSGEGFEYLKKVVEKITGKKVEQVLQEEVLGPLGLYHTYFSKNAGLEKMAAEGHFDNIPSAGGIPEEPGMAYSMYTEAKAFTHFMLALLEQKGLTSGAYEQMLSPQSEYPQDGPEKPRFKEYMGISLNIRETPHGKVFGHGGNNGDFRCEFEVYKDLKMGYAVFTNSSTAYPFIDALSDFLVDGKEKK